MKDKSVEATWKTAKRQRILEAAFREFSERGIEPVTMPEIAKASGVPRATIYRYYLTKLELVVAIGAWKWSDYISAYQGSISQEAREGMTAATQLRYYLDAYIDLYRRHSDILRFNYDFNGFLRTQGATDEQKHVYMRVVENVGAAFHALYEKGRKDGTLNMEITEEAMLSSSFHIMLSAVTRYAVGLVYVPQRGSDPESELLMLEDLLLQKFARS